MVTRSIANLTNHLEVLTQILSEAMHRYTTASEISRLNQRAKALRKLKRFIDHLEERIEQVKHEILEKKHEHLLITLIKEMTKRQADDHGSCSVCLEAYKVEESVTTTPCGHKFHLDCLLQWIDEDKITCPLCRANLGR